MHYFILAFFVLIAFFFFYKIVLPLSEPDFKLKGQLSQAKLYEKVRELALSARNVKERGKGLSLRLIKKNINKAYSQIALKVKNKEDCFEFENWIYDNYYKFNEILFSLKKDLNKFYFLPHTDNLPRVYEFMQLVVKSCDGCVTEELLKGAVESFNSETPMKFNEITALKSALEYALLEYIAIFCSKSVLIGKTMKRAKLDAQKNKIDLTLIRYNSYVYSYNKFAPEKVRRNLTTVCLENGIDFSSRIESFYLMTSRYNGQIQSAVTTLHKSVRIFTDEYTIKLSSAYSMLNQERDICFKEVSLATKYLYLENIFLKAKKKKISELALCRDIIESSHRKNTDVSFEILPAAKGKKFSYLYMAAFILLTLGLSFTVPLFFGNFYFPAAFISMPIFFAFSSIIMRSGFGAFTVRRRLPSYDLKYRKRENYRTLITVCRLIGDSAEADDAFKNLETIIYANSDAAFSYCLLLDLPSSNDENGNYEDAGILERIEKLYDENENKSRITVLVRNRKKIKDGDKFQGWEKKRGAIIELNRYLLGQTGGDGFLLKKGGADKIKYVLTLDSDTLTNGALNMVSLMEHPYNSDKNIISINMNTNSSDMHKTYFAKFFCGGAGLDNYSSYIADPEHDLFLSGNYTGKGIYRVKEFHEKLSAAFEDNRILSHDYIEGAYAACCNSNETALDSFPLSFSQFLTRQLRWLRGDWQLLPYLKRKVKDGGGSKIANPILPINKWHIFSNLFLSLIPVCSLALLILSIFIENPYWVVLLAFLLPATYFLLSLRSSVLSMRNFWIMELARQIISIAMLPTIAFYHLVSIITTIYRLFKKKKLLEWKVFAHAKGKVNFVPNYIAVIVFLSCGIVLNLNVIFYILSGLFILAPVLDFILSKGIKQRRYESRELDENLKNTAALTYKYFEDNFSPQNNYLPCDNYQEDLENPWIERTSPTNIGYAILSRVCAHILELIDSAKLNEDILKIVETLEKMPKWKGNLYNWYDVKTLAPLYPNYVSSVDCGNFLACLTAVLPYAEEQLYSKIMQLIRETNLGALFDIKRGLYRIGYNRSTGEYDETHYDLLGSESSLLYLISTAFSKTDKSAWNNLSRRTVRFCHGEMFYSWTGGMFEHLMCPLFFKYDKGTVFYSSAKNVVKAQKMYAKLNNHKIYGVSECQYDKLDNNGLYQYKAFGVPQISLSNIENDSVAAPYAAILALNYDTKAAVKNIENIEKASLKGKYGYYESIDLKKNKIMRTYMTHHQGMILAAVCNRLSNNALNDTLKKRGEIRAAELLLTQAQKINGGRKMKIPQLRAAQTAQSIKIANRTSVPYVNLLSHGKYASVINSDGGGYSVLGQIMLTRCVSRNDGIKVFVENNAEKISLTSGTCEFNEENCVFEVKSSNFYAHTEVCVLPGGGEARIIEYINTTDKKQSLVFSTYCEPVLTDRNADIAHRAYSNMFIQTFYDGFNDFIYAKRNNKDNPIIFAHAVQTPQKVEYTTSRHKFYKKNSSHPDFGTPLDPVLSGSFKVELKPKCKIKFSAFWYAAANLPSIEASVKMSRTAGYTDRIKGSNYALAKSNQMSLALKRTAAAILYNSTCTRVNGMADNYSPRPIVAIEINSAEAIVRLKDKLTELKKLYAFHIEFNLVIVYKEKHNYYLHMTEKLNTLLDELSFRKALNPLSTLRLINAEQNEAEAEYALKNSIAFDTANFDATEQNSRPPYKAGFDNALLQMPEIVLKAGFGGFTQNSGYFMDLSEETTPAPWSNIIANKEFGTIITESGGGYTYYSNSRQNKITDWSNDAVLDPPSEFIVLGEKGALWSITQKPVKAKCNYTACHNLGYSEFICNYNGMLSSQKVFIDKDSPVKYYEITLENKTNHKREIDVMFSFLPVLGDFKLNCETGLDVKKEGSFISIKNCLNNMKVYAGVNKKIESFSRYKESITDRDGNIVKNAELINEGSDLFISMSVKAEIESGKSVKIIFSLGAEKVMDYSKTEEILSLAAAFYSSLSAVLVNEGGGAVWEHMNKWLPYQVLCSRFYAKAGFYQAGGAIGFRDQLQDCLALLHVNPKLVKEHIINAASHQFEEGDVQHWWHPPATGVRTYISDDKLFLPLLVSEYLNYTHDFSLLNERAPYLESVKIKDGEHSAYTSATFTSRGAPITEHCLKAIYSGFDFGENGLIKMRGGDWNDAMDLVGAKGAGTSVWLTMFLYYVCDKFLPFVNSAQDRQQIIENMKKLKEALGASFDGEWFTRAYTDDGTVLGSADSPECKIDLISQSFAVLSNACDKEKCETALKSAEKYLVDYDNKIIKLLTPPFKDMENIGYITKYPQGVRENGGQYTHAAVWYIMALIKTGKTEKAWELFNMINPFNKSKTLEDAKKYVLEPYVLAADVYSERLAGTGGWSWYTGSAAWYYKCLIEEFYGIKKCGGKLIIEPNLPLSVKKISLDYKTGAGIVKIEIDNSQNGGKWMAKVNNISYGSNEIEFSPSLSGKKIKVYKEKI